MCHTSSKQFVFHPMPRLKTRTRLCVCFKVEKTDLIPAEATLLISLGAIQIVYCLTVCNNRVNKLAKFTPIHDLRPCPPNP